MRGKPASFQPINQLKAQSLRTHRLLAHVSLLFLQVYGLERDSRNVEQLRLKPAEKLSITQSDADLLEQHRKVSKSAGKSHPDEFNGAKIAL